MAVYQTLQPQLVSSKAELMAQQFCKPEQKEPAVESV